VPLPADFQFSQASLQDYVDCPRRFQLRYLLHLAWPAVETEPVSEHEEHLRQGQAFHQLVHQHLLGVPAKRLTHLAETEGGPLSQWWENYLRTRPADFPATRHPEITLSAPLAGHRLLAKYDLIAIEPGQQAIIVDWKTSHKRPRQAWLSARLQTRVYRYLLVRAGSDLNAGTPIQPEHVEMLYWFTNYPDDPERLPYDATQYEADAAYLVALVAEIKALGDDDFPLTNDARRCRFCAYRSLCDRGAEAGAWDEADAEGLVAGGEEEVGDALDLDLDFEQIAEIAF